MCGQARKVAIVGPSGAGKSTIFHLLLRFYDPASGNVSLDGVSLTQADPSAVRSRIALVPQDYSAMFAASIADNIRFGRPGASDADVKRAADNGAAASEFIARMPQGMETSIGERGRHRSPAVSAAPALSRLRVRSCAKHRCCCSTKRPRRSMRRMRHWFRPRSTA